MIRLPVLQRLRVEDYGLFPGLPAGTGIDWHFERGVSLIAGINGLGKTTLLTMILRAFTGPADLTGDGAPPQLGVIIPANAAELRGHAMTFFVQRVADASRATVLLEARFGSRHFKVHRRLTDLSVIELEVDRAKVDLPAAKADRQAIVQDMIAELMGVGAFVDVLLLLHHVIMFHEDRPGALWDQNAQRHVLRALFFERSDAQTVARLEREVQSADSQARNTRTRITATERDLDDIRRREKGSEGTVAELKAQQALLDAELEEVTALEERLAGLDQSRKLARLEVERAKLERESATGAVERLKYTALLNLFPSMNDASRLVVARLMADGTCLVCHSVAPAKQAELEVAIAEGRCPCCGTPPALQENVHPAHEFEQAKLDKARQRLKQVKDEEQTRSAQLKQFSDDYNGALSRILELRASISDRRQKEGRLRSQLPLSASSSNFASALVALRAQEAEHIAKRSVALNELKSLIGSREDRITSKAHDLATTFASLTHALLAEDVRIVPVENAPKYLQAPGPQQDRLTVPAFVAEMTAADRPGYVRRETPSDVSESQRELIDLAFRLALVKAATGGDGCTFIMETPEASLDGVAMDRVGAALVQFATQNDNRLVVTSNLTNAGLIGALLGGATNDEAEIAKREDRVLNLLRLAKPNRALERDRGEYEALLKQSIRGGSH